MLDPRTIQQHFERAAETYEAQAALQHDVRAHALEYMQPLWRSGDVVLDLGSGGGYLGDAAEAAGTSLICMDLSHAMCMQAKKKTGRAIQANARLVPLADHSIHHVFSSLTMQWVEPLADALAECARIIPHGGYLCMTTFCSGTLPEMKEALRAIGKQDSAHVFLEVDAIVNQAMQAGFVPLNVEERTMTTEYESTQALLAHFKKLGAQSANQTRSKSVWTRGLLDRFDAAYPRTEGRVQARWKIGMFLLQKGVC